MNWAIKAHHTDTATVHPSLLRRPRFNPSTDDPTLSIRFRSRKSVGQTFTVLEWVFTDPVRRPLQPQLQRKLLNGGTVDHVHISALPEGFNFFENIARDWNRGWHGTQNIRLNLCRNGSDFQSGLTASAVRNRRGIQPFWIAILPPPSSRCASLARSSSFPYQVRIRTGSPVPPTSPVGTGEIAFVPHQNPAHPSDASIHSPISHFFVLSVCAAREPERQ